MKLSFYFAALLGIVYTASLSVHPYPFSYVLKAAPVMLLALIGWRTLSGGAMYLYVSAMFGSAAGDVFLDIDRQLYLKQALLAFLVTQLCYIALFLQRRTKRDTSPLFLIMSVCLPVAVAAFLLYQFYPNTAGLWWPVVGYVSALTAMAICALQTKQRWIAVGGCLFMLADAMIGINRFWLPFDWSTLAIVSVYMTAQLCIGYGVLFVSVVGLSRGDKPETVIILK